MIELIDFSRDYLAEWEAEAEKRALVPKGRNDRPLCLAKRRDGHPCQAQATLDKRTKRVRNGRCRLHGGLSSGPKTEEGRARIGQATRKRNQQRAAERLKKK